MQRRGSPTERLLRSMRGEHVAEGSADDARPSVDFIHRVSAPISRANEQAQSGLWRPIVVAFVILVVLIVVVRELAR